MKFNCSGCGSCCKRVGMSLEMLKKMDFPYEVKEDGMTCEKFDELTKKCTVYNNRPVVCNIDKMFYIVHSKSGKTKKETFLNEAKICNSWMDEDGVDVTKRVDLKQYQ
jgi:uncharacterized protein